MKKIITLLAGLSLALAVTVMAQEPSPGESPGKQGKHEKATQGTTETKQKPNAGETKAGRNANVNAEKPTTAETGVKQRGAKGERGAKSQGAMNAETSPATETNAAQTEGAGKRGKHGKNATQNAAAETGASASPGASQPMEQQGKKGRKGRAATAGTSATAAPSASASMTPATARTSPIASPTAATSMTPAASATIAASATAGATGANATLTKEQGTVGRGGKKVEKQQLQQIKQQHATFKAQPRPDKAPAVTFNQNYRIEGSQQWQGAQYEVFRSYHPEWHDRNWYHSRYQRVELIGGGYYYWNNGYWYPAWGYDSGAAYYAYDGPIYVGHRAEPPDRVIADVQAELQEMGYYTGEVDGLLGPLTRQALRDYQADHGLQVTQVIDEPTLDALELG